MPSINLPYGNNSFDSNRLKEHIRRTGRDYIIQGQKICRRIDHPKPNSLDCWLRDNYASNPDTKQAVNEVISDLVNTGDFVKEDFHCPDSHRRCKGIRIAEGEKASSLFTGYPKLRAPDELYVKEMNYSHFQHRHNFAVWCAARAVQRGFVKTPVLKEAIEKSGIVEFVRKNENKKIPQEKFDKFHGEWCDSIIKTWENMNVKGSSYGRAAKLIAVYIKSMIVVKNGQSNLSEVAYPPIDRVILQNISNDKTIKHPNRPFWKAIKWTKLDKTQYLKLIGDFRKVFHGKPFWLLEQYWFLTND